MNVHQIWIGEQLPEKEAALVQGIRTAVLAAGHKHTLWDFPALAAAFADDPATTLFSRLMETLPCVTLYTLASDYYRLALLAKFGGLYLDTDFELAPGAAFPELPAVADVYGMPEFFNRLAMCNGLLYLPPDKSRAPFEQASERAAARLAEHIENAQSEEDLTRIRLDKFIGPAWIRADILPRWMEEGVTVAFLPAAIAGHVQWKEKSALTHIGTAHWHSARRAKPPLSSLPPERKQAQLTLASQLLRAAAQTSRCAENEATPPPSAEAPLLKRRIVPQARSLPADLAPSARPWAQPARGKKNPWFEVPEKTQRIIVLSNVQKDFYLPPLRDTDLVVHLNHATHAARAMEEEPSATHVCFVRGSASFKNTWFSPGSDKGFASLVHIQDSVHFHPMQWFANWRARSSKSPTTGFGVANMLRELYPSLPLILAGFDPARDHGAVRHPHHDWQAEAQWYADKGFTLLRPGAMARRACDVGKALLLVISCERYEEKRQACRDTWLQQLPEGWEYRFIIGRQQSLDHAPLAELHPSEPDTLIVNAGDSYIELPEKVRAAIAATLDIDYEWLIKCDDDTYMRLDRIPAILEPDVDMIGRRSVTHRYALGGAGYCMRHKVTRALIAAHNGGLAPIPGIGNEDVRIGYAATELGFTWHNSNRLCQYYTPHDLPTPTNNLISAHQLTPDLMHQIHRNNSTHA